MAKNDAIPRDPDLHDDDLQVVQDPDTDPDIEVEDGRPLEDYLSDDELDALLSEDLT